MWYKNIVGRFFGLVTKHACDRQTDGQNYGSQDRASIAASRGNKTLRNNIELLSAAAQLYEKSHFKRLAIRE